MKKNIYSFVIVILMGMYAAGTSNAYATEKQYVNDGEVSFYGEYVEISKSNDENVERVNEDVRNIETLPKTGTVRGINTMLFSGIVLVAFIAALYFRKNLLDY